MILIFELANFHRTPIRKSKNDSKYCFPCAPFFLQQEMLIKYSISLQNWTKLNVKRYFEINCDQNIAIKISVLVKM